MLAGRVRVRGIEDVRLQDRSADRPGPRTCRRCQNERGSYCREQNSTHHSPLRSTDSSRRPVVAGERTCVPVHGRGGCPPLSNEITKLSQSGAVEVVPRRVREARDDVRGNAPRRAGGDELRDCRPRRVAIVRRAPAGPNTSVTSPLTGRANALGELGRGADCHLLESLRQLTAHRQLALRIGRRERAKRLREPLRRLEGDRGPPPVLELAPERVELAGVAGAGSRGRGSGRSARPLVTSAVSTAEGPGSTDTSTPAARAARTRRAPGSEIAGRPASETRAIRSPLCEAGQELGDTRRLVVLVVGEESSLDPVALEQAARMPRVLGEDEVGRRGARRARAA